MAFYALYIFTKFEVREALHLKVIAYFLSQH